MADRPMIDVNEFLSKQLASASPDLLREMVTTFAETLMGAEVATPRLQGVLTTLNDLPGYDDSTGLGSPYAPGFIAHFQAALPPAAALPEAAEPAGMAVFGLFGGLGLLAARRRRRARCLPLGCSGFHG